MQTRPVVPARDPRAVALACVFGWPEASPLQITEQTGLNINQFLSVPADPYDEEFRAGWFAARTCTLDWNLDHNFPAYRGRVQFWIGVAEAVSTNTVTSSVSIRNYIAQQRANRREAQQ
jgi:hypothetical protein